jgi:hypothetical protein
MPHPACLTLSGRFWLCPTRACVAQAMGISLSNLKKLCRNLGIRRWPQRKLQSLENMKQAIVGDAVLSQQQKEVCAWGGARPGLRPGGRAAWPAHGA